MSGARLAEELEALFDGRLSHCRGMLAPPGDERPFAPAADLLEPGSLEEVLVRFRRSHGGGADRRVVASLWSQWYFGTLVPPAVAAGVLRRRVLPLGIRDLGVLLDEETGRPMAFRLPHGGRIDADASPFERFRALVRDHLAPLTETLAPHVGLSPDAVWTNAGRYVQWILDEIAGTDLVARIDGEEEEEEERPSGVARTRRLLDAETWPDGWENPLHGTIRYVEEGGERIARRRVCCLQYLVPELDGCGALCPLPEVRKGTTASD